MHDALKQQVLNYIDANKEEYISTGREFYRHPELAFREEETSGRIVQRLESLRLDHVERVARTGVNARLDTGRPGKCMGVIAEIDALYQPNHPDADGETGAAHVCGHHIQTAALCGVAAALKNTGVYRQLNGQVAFVACPAEEGGVPDALFERLQREEGLQTRSGKQEMIRRGCFAGVDGLLSTHALINDGTVTQPALLSAGCNGFNNWTFTLVGRTAHPTMDPSKGANAMNAAVLALHALQGVRESLPLDDYAIILPSLDEIHKLPGAIPDSATLRVTTKSKTPAVLADTDQKVLKALEGAALALGCGLEHRMDPGYMPYVADEALSRVYMDNCAALTGQAVKVRPHGYFSNDLGNVSQLVPVSQIVVGGFSGALHSERFRIDNEELAYLLPAKMMACTLIDLLR